MTLSKLGSFCIVPGTYLPLSTPLAASPISSSSPPPLSKSTRYSPYRGQLRATRHCPYGDTTPQLSASNTSKGSALSRSHTTDKCMRARVGKPLRHLVSLSALCDLRSHPKMFNNTVHHFVEGMPGEKSKLQHNVGLFPITPPTIAVS